jgi:hypothetical protein
MFDMFHSSSFWFLNNPFSESINLSSSALFKYLFIYNLIYSCKLLERKPNDYKIGINKHPGNTGEIN